MSILILVSFLTFSLANDFFNLSFTEEVNKTEVYMGFLITSGGVQGGGIFTYSLMPSTYEQTFTCSTCDSGVAQSQVTIMGTDGSDTIIKASPVARHARASVTTPYWGHGDPLTMSWNYDGSNVTFYVSGTEYTPYCREDDIGFSAFYLVDGGDDSEHRGYVECSTMGSISIVY